MSNQVMAEITNVEMDDGSTGTMWAWMQMWNGMYCIYKMYPTLAEAEAEAEKYEAQAAEYKRYEASRQEAVRQAHEHSISREYQVEMLDKAAAYFAGQCEDVGIETLWARLVDNVTKLPERGVIECGGCGFEDTPAALYRLLWLAKPDNLDLLDMYKQELFVLTSRCRQFFVEVCTWKYELSLRFYCTLEHHVSYRDAGPMQVFAGNPSADNGYGCTSEIGRRWFDFVRQAAATRHVVYPGNDFEV